jgi:hypothetical protein
MIKVKYDLSFSINLRDEDGDSYEDCILLHLGNGVILQFENMDSYERFIDNMRAMKGEIQENLMS